jgi:hypothetical protein
MLVQIRPGKPDILLAPQAPKVEAPQADPTLVLLSRAPGLAGFVEEEFAFFKTCMTPLHKRWVRFRRHFLGIYGEEFTAQEGQSDLFIKRTRERVSTAFTKLMKLILPMVGDPWDLRVSPRPQNPFGTDPKQAVAGMRQAIRDHLANMQFNKTLRYVVWDECLFGTGITYGPVGVTDPNPAWARIRGITLPQEVRPDIQHVPIWELYTDPMVAKKERVASAIWRRVLNRKQLVELGRVQGFDPTQIDLLLQALPKGNYVREYWETELAFQTPKEPRWAVYERWGLVDQDKQEEWGLDETTTGFVSSWTCGPFTLALFVDPMYEHELPFDWIPYEQADGSIYGSGVAEHVEDIQIMENALGRALHNNLADSSIPQVELDMTQLDPGTDPRWKAGKTWLKRPNELAKGMRAVDFYLPPNNSGQILQAWQLFESLMPVVSSMPVVENPGAMGSGVRTDGMQTRAYSTAEGFIRNVVGNNDEFGWVVWIGRLFNWEMGYGKDDSVKGDLQPVALGVYGAVRREQIAQNAGLLRQLAGDPELAPYLNNPKILYDILPALGLEDEGYVLSPDQVAAKMQLESQHEAMKAGMTTLAEQAVSHGIRASASRADALLTILRSIKDDSNPAWGPTFQQAMEAQGAMTPAIYIALQAWALNMQADVLAKGGAGMGQEWSAVMQSFHPQKILDLDPDYRPRGANMALPGQDGQPALGMGPQSDGASPNEKPETQTLAPDATRLSGQEGE